MKTSTTDSEAINRFCEGHEIDIKARIREHEANVETAKKLHDGGGLLWVSRRSTKIRQLIQDVDYLGRTIRKQGEDIYNLQQQVYASQTDIDVSEPESTDPHRSPFEFPVPREVIDVMIRILGEMPKNADAEGTAVYRWLLTLKEFHDVDSAKQENPKYTPFARVAIASAMVSLSRHIKREAKRLPVEKHYRNGMFHAAGIVDQILDGSIELDS